MFRIDDRTRNDLDFFFNLSAGAMGIRSAQGGIERRLQLGVAVAGGLHDGIPDSATEAAARYKRVHRQLITCTPAQQGILRAYFTPRDLRGGLTEYGDAVTALWAVDEALALYRHDGGADMSRFPAWLASLVSLSRMKKKKDDRRVAAGLIAHLRSLANRKLTDALVSYGATLEHEGENHDRVTIPELAEATGLTEVAVRQRLSRGRVPRTKVGKRVFVERSAWQRVTAPSAG